MTAEYEQHVPPSSAWHKELTLAAKHAKPWAWTLAAGWPLNRILLVEEDPIDIELTFAIRAQPGQWRKIMKKCLF